MSLPKYPKYKEFGIEWLGELPEHWTVMQSRRMFSVRNQAAEASDRQVTASQKYGILFQTDFVELEGRRVVETIKGTDTLRRIEPNDFVISLRSFQGGIEWCRLQGSITFHYVVLTPRKHVFEPFFAYLFKSERYIQALRATTDLIRDGQDLRYSHFVQVSLPVIPMDEQIQIAAFLDREIPRINELVAEQQRLIELLKEKRQAVISHTVTKGLNPKVPMKPSGIEWLGEVPDHWEIARVKNYFQTSSGGTPNTQLQDMYYTDEEGNGIPWVRTTDLENDVLSRVPIYITDKALNDTACAILPPGTVMVAMYGGDGTVGKNGLLSIPAAINQAVCGLLPSGTHLPEYAFRFIQFYRPYWMIGAESSRKDPNISQERVRNAPFPKPPLDEQSRIVRYLDSELEKLDSLSNAAHGAIELLQERRTALISAAVTGKIDVRELVNLEAA